MIQKKIIHYFTKFNYQLWISYSFIFIFYLAISKLIYLNVEVLIEWEWLGHCLHSSYGYWNFRHTVKQLQLFSHLLQLHSFLLIIVLSVFSLLIQVIWINFWYYEILNTFELLYLQFEWIALDSFELLWDQCWIPKKLNLQECVCLSFLGESLAWIELNLIY